MSRRSLITVDRLSEVISDLRENGCGHYLVGIVVNSEQEIWEPAVNYKIDVDEETLDLCYGH